MSIFSETLIFLRSRASLSREELSEALGVSASHIKRLETEYIAPDEKMLGKIAEYFSVTPEYLLGNTSRQVIISEPAIGFKGRFISVPVLEAKNAMKMKIHESEIIERMVIPMPGNKRCDYVAVLIEDDASCCGRMQKGDIAIIERSNQLTRDDLVAVSHKGGPVFFRYYARLGPTVILSTNGNFERIIYNINCDEYEIVGKVISFTAKL